MRIHWGGYGKRMIGKFTWSRESGYTVDLPGKVAADCLAQPGEPFSVAADEPLRRLDGITDEALFELAMAGIGTLGELARAQESALTDVRVDAKKLTAWIAQAGKKNK